MELTALWFAQPAALQALWFLSGAVVGAMIVIVLGLWWAFDGWAGDSD